MWCDVWVWASALQPHTHNHTHIHSLSFVLVAVIHTISLPYVPSYPNTSIYLQSNYIVKKFSAAVRELSVYPDMY